MKNLLKVKKIKLWIFGHLHLYQCINEYKNNIKFICNPRCVPQDYNKSNYKIITIELM